MPALMHHVDAFTDRAFAGNPAGVCLLDKQPTDRWMSAVASEMSLNETAFCWPRGSGSYELRWWTPTVEVPLCGHATLATAHVLWTERRAPSGESIIFCTRSGDLMVRPDGDLIELNFPAYNEREVPAEHVADFERIVGLKLPVLRAYGPKALAELESRGAVESLRPDLDRLGVMPYEGLIVTAAPPDGEADYVLRYFAPAVGIPEDPVTGSAQCAAGPFWGARLGLSEMVAEQLSARHGRMRVKLNGKRVGIAGTAVTISRGLLDVKAESAP